MLSIQNLSMSYRGGKKVVSDLSLEVEAGDIFGFIGHNGAGKTTTIKCVVGINDFQEGEILVNGISVKKDPMTCKELFAYIPDNPDLYEYLTGIQYLNFIADIFKISKEEREQRIHNYADEFEITSALGDLISSYSHGMKQKLAIIGALIHQPKLLILDEPFVGLDPKATLILKNIITKRKHCKIQCFLFLFIILHYGFDYCYYYFLVFCCYCYSFYFSCSLKAPPFV